MPKSSAKESAASSRKPSLDENDGTCSLIINCAGQRLYCHKDFLSMWSPVLKELCAKASEQEVAQSPRSEDEDDLLEVEVEEDYDDFKEFLLCLYPKGKNVDDDNVEIVLAVASTYETGTLKQKCEDVLMKRDASVQNMLIADAYDLPNLKERNAKGCAEMSLDEIESAEGFEELNEESKMLLWKERALFLEEKQEEFDEVGEKVYMMTKFVSRKHQCKSIPEERFTTVTQFTKDARGRKTKETIENACYVKIGEVNHSCRGCFMGFGKSCLKNISALEERKTFDKLKENDNITNIHFHPRN